MIRKKANIPLKKMGKKNEQATHTHKEGKGAVNTFKKFVVCSSQFQTKSKFSQELVMDREAWHSAGNGVAKSWT